MHLVCARMKLICIKGLEDDDNDIDDVFHVDYSDRFISVCGYIFAKGNGWRCSSLDQERRRGKKVVRIQKLFRIDTFICNDVAFCNYCRRGQQDPRTGEIFNTRCGWTKV